MGHGSTYDVCLYANELAAKSGSLIIGLKLDALVSWFSKILKDALFMFKGSEIANPSTKFLSL